MPLKKDIMDTILDGQGDDAAAPVDELNCLIYKKAEKLEDKASSDPDSRILQTEKEHITVQVWEGKAKIKVKVSSGTKKSISMKRIADIAANAILEELKKED